MTHWLQLPLYTPEGAVRMDTLSHYPPAMQRAILRTMMRAGVVTDIKREQSRGLKREREDRRHPGRAQRRIKRQARKAAAEQHARYEAAPGRQQARKRWAHKRHLTPKGAPHEQES